MNFGLYITNCRKNVGLSQKDLAARILKEDGGPISPQYLNDIERNRRNPPSEFLLNQLANILDLSLDYLRFLAGRLPEDIPTGVAEPEKVEEAFKVFRKLLSDKQ